MNGKILCWEVCLHHSYIISVFFFLMTLSPNWARELQIPFPKFSFQFPILHIKPAAGYRAEHLCISLVPVLQRREKGFLENFLEKFSRKKLHITFGALGGILKRWRGKYTSLVPLYL